MKRMHWLLALAALLLLLGGCRTAPLSGSDFLLDTAVSVTLYGGGSKATLEGALELCRRYDRMFSRTDPESEVYRLNHAGGEAIAVPRELREVLETAIAYAELTGGRYDVTICPVTDLWNFTAADPSLPDPEALREAVSRVNWRNIVLEGDTARLLHGAQIDLGSIAKGYIADRMADSLREQGVSSAIINLGGNILTVGGKPDGSPFRIGVQRPFERREETVGTVEVKDRSVVSSGVYERSFVLDGRRYHHILDPATGYPADTGLTGVTVVSDRSVDGDALSTVLFLLGPEEGPALAERIPGVDAVFITEEGEVRFTSGFGRELPYTPAEG